MNKLASSFSRTSRGCPRVNRGIEGKKKEENDILQFGSFNTKSLVNFSRAFTTFLVWMDDEMKKGGMEWSKHIARPDKCCWDNTFLPALYRWRWIRYKNVWFIDVIILNYKSMIYALQALFLLLILFKSISFIAYIYTTKMHLVFNWNIL